MPKVKAFNATEIEPRQVANKSQKVNLDKAIQMALVVESEAVRLNTQTFNQNRYQAIAEIEDYESLKDQARTIKEYSIEHIEELIERLKNVIEGRGGYFYLAKDKQEANEYIKKVCLQHRAKLIVKAKSITSEETKLNHILEDAGIEVAETDLAEFILQVSHEQPSHIVAPAIHRSRERISELFKQNFKTDQPLDSGEELTKFAREILRKKFLTADIGISGANMLAADSGTLLLVESEGNIRMVTQAPPVHIALAGIEKIIPSFKDLAPFIELLAASGTGQPLSTYTNVLNPPLNLPSFSFDGREKKEREFHLVLLDNGRMRMRDDPELRQALYCIRCSACLNSCANFQAVGGHAFGGETYSGGIGGAWEAGTGKLGNARFAELCTGCTRCVPNCPVRIDIPWLNTVIRDRLHHIENKKPPLQKRFFANFAYLGKLTSPFPRLANWSSGLSISRTVLEKIVGADQRRELPSFVSKTLVKQFSKYRTSQTSAVRGNIILGGKVILFADVYTNYNNPQCGMAIVKIFDRLGIEIRLSAVLAEGRASQSQGLIDLASKRAHKVSTYLEKFVDEGYDIVCAEPSVLALFRRDYKNLIGSDELFEKINMHSFDPFEYLNIRFTEQEIDPKNCFDIKKSPTTKLFYHGHCQAKTIDAGFVAADFLENLGCNIIISHSECCGMAGSFGYKSDYYDLSKNVGEDLIQQIDASDSPQDYRVVLASGTSCREQIRSETDRIVLHPIEFLEKIMV